MEKGKGGAGAQDPGGPATRRGVARGEATFGRRKVLDRHVRGPLSPLRAHVGPW